MELTLKDKLFYWKQIIKKVEQIEDSIISLQMIYLSLEIEKEYQQELDDLYEEMKEHIEYIKYEIKEKYNLSYILNIDIKNITLDDILEL